MRLTVLGNNGPYPAAGGACSGYLLQDDGINILLDCGNGVLSNLQKYIGIDEIDAVILTHLHSDHMSDMMVLRYAIQTRPLRGLPSSIINVYAPDEPEEEFNRLEIKDAYKLHVINPRKLLTIGNLKLSFLRMNHPYKCFGVSVDNGSRRFVYTGDTAVDSTLVSFFRNADALLVDAGLITKFAVGNAVHMTAAESGKLAAEAGAKRLILTHFLPESDQAGQLAEAKKYFDNTVTSELLASYEI